MTQAQQAVAPAGAPEEKPKEKEEFYMQVPQMFWHWEPTEEYLESNERFPDTSYAASLALIHANRGIVPEVLLVRQNPNDAEKFTQHKGPVRTRPDSWKMPIGRFYPFRYLDDEKNSVYDNHLWDTVIEEIREETGIDFRPKDDNDEEGNTILKSLMRAPVAEYRKRSQRPPHRYHIDRVHFFVTPRVFVPDPKVYKKAIELTEVKFFPLREFPRMDLNGDGATMLFSHVHRLVQFFELPKTQDIKWLSGIPEDVSETIRARFPEYDIPRMPV